MSTITLDEVIRQARDALQRGHYPLACELLREPLQTGADNAELRYLAALAHARIGALGRAQEWVDTLLDDPRAAAMQSDVRALAGRIAKDRWSRLPDGPARTAAGKCAIAHYLHAWETSQDPFPGVNAATLLALTGQPHESTALALQVRECAQSSDSLQTVMWREATLGELAVLLDDHISAANHYAQAVLAAGARRGDIASMRRQLQLLSACLPVPPSVLAALPMPCVVVFTGHMIDAADRIKPRFPHHLEADAAAAISDALHRLDAGVGYSAAGCGADLLFLEAMHARGAETHIVLPFDSQDFIRTSVAFAGQHWVERFEAALATASRVSHAVEERFLGDVSLFDHAGKLMQGAAMLHARSLHTDVVMLALIDPAATPLPGGTQSLVQQWQQRGRRQHCIDLAALRSVSTAVPAAPPAPSTPAQDRRAPLRRQVATMLFADMVGYSRLDEEDTPAYLVSFLGAIADLLREGAARPVFSNTWGDGVFLVFDGALAAAECALRLRDAVRITDWPARGLPAGTSMRIGMHTGPVFRAHDPLLLRDNFFGSHVTRAARIEPVTPPCEVFISEAMAWVLAAEGSPGLVADYLGLTPLAKNHAPAVLYRLRRQHEAD